MKEREQKIFFKLSKISLLLLYIPFFVVQCFFNVDSPFPNNKIVNLNIDKQVASQKAAASFHSIKNTNHGGNIRLNKRFQPEGAPIVVPPIYTINDYLIQANLFYTYPDPLFPSFHLIVNKLRGPPVVV